MKYDAIEWRKNMCRDAIEFLEGKNTLECAKVVAVIGVLQEDAEYDRDCIAKLTEALKPFAYDVADCFQDEDDTEITVKIKDLRAARAAYLGEKE